MTLAAPDAIASLTSDCSGERPRLRPLPGDQTTTPLSPGQDDTVVPIESHGLIFSPVRYDHRRRVDHLLLELPYPAVLLSQGQDRHI